MSKSRAAYQKNKILAWCQKRYVPVDEFLRDAEAVGHVVDGERAIGLQKLSVRSDPHFPDVVVCVWCQNAV